MWNKYTISSQYDTTISQTEKKLCETYSLNDISKVHSLTILLLRISLFK